MDIKDVENLAELARIELTDDEKKGILKDMDGILEYVKQIEEVKLDEVTPEYNLKNVWREDLPAPRLRGQEAGEVISRDFDKDLITSQFPDSQPACPHDSSGAGEDGIFLKVKKIL